MKRFLALVLTLSLIASMFSGCMQQPATSIASTSAAATAETAAPETTVPDIAAETETATADTSSEPEKEIPSFTGLSDPELLTYLEDDIYSTLESQFSSDDYIIENISTSYLSKEHLSELEYNSKENIFFGYTLSDLEAEFNGTRYIFTLGEDGSTVVTELETLEDDTYSRILKNVAIGEGVIFITATVTALAPHLGVPATVAYTLAVSAKTALSVAKSTAFACGLTQALITGYQTGDVKKAIKSAALGASNGFKWGAISGAVVGGIGEGTRIHKILHNKDLTFFQKSEHLAQELYGGNAQCTYLAGKKVDYGTAGATRPDLMRNIGGHFEAIEVKNYNLSNPACFSNLKRELHRQVSERIVNLPEGTTQRIVLDVSNRNFSSKLTKNAVSEIQKYLADVYPNIPVDIMR